MILLVLVALVALVIAAGHTFARHCENRFNTDVFEVTGILVHIGGWALVIAGLPHPTINILFLGIGAAILIFQFFRLTARTSFFHGITAFMFLSLLTASIALVVFLLIASAANCNNRRRVIFID